MEDHDGRERDRYRDREVHMTVTSDTQICNLALTRLGHSTITSLAQQTKGAILCNLHYTICRDAVLRAHPWNFAIKRAALASDASASIPFEYTYRFPLPDDCLKVIRTSCEATNSVSPGAIYGWPGLVGGGVTPSYRIEGKAIMTNDSTMLIEYIARITDVTQFDALFVDCLAARIAAEIATALTDNGSLAAGMMDIYTRKLSEARSVDAQEGTPRDIVDASGWIMARI
jgi:hypothetical protein